MLFEVGVMKAKRKVKKNKSIILRLLILCVCAYFTFSLATLWNTLNESKAELKALEEEYTSISNDIEEYRKMLSSDSNKEIIEKAARERLGYVYSDEQIFIDISGN